MANRLALAEAAEAPVIQLGGPHRDVKWLAGYESPSKAASTLSESEGPAIALRKEDHALTASHGSGLQAKLYRQRQANLIARGRFRDAQQMDIDNIRSLFENRYDDAIQQMLTYTRRLGL